MVEHPHAEGRELTSQFEDCKEEKICNNHVKEELESIQSRGARFN